MSTAYQDPRPVAASLQKPEVDRASLNDVLQDQGWGVQAVNWVFEAVTGESLVATIITPITGDWTKIRADGDAWRMVGNAMNDVSYNLTDAVGKVRDHWDGDAARAHEKYIALGWKAGLLAEMGVAQLIAKGFDTVASGAEALGKQAARLLDYLVNKLLEAAATVWLPVAGWIKAAEMVWNAYQIYRRVMDIIDTVKKLITDVKSLFDAVGRVFSAIGKLKDADSLAEAMNATQEVAEAGRDVRNSVNDIHDDMTSIKDSATEIGERGRDIGSQVREVYTPPGAADGDGTKAAAVSAVTPGGAPVSAPPTLAGGPDAPATHTAAAAGPGVSAPPSVGGGSGGGPAGGSGGIPSGGSGGVPSGGSGMPAGGAPTPSAPVRPDMTHAAGTSAPAAAPPSHHSTPVGGAMPMGAPPAGAGGGDSTRSSSSRPGGAGVPAFPTAGSPSGSGPGAGAGTGRPPAGGPGSGLPTPPSHSGPGLPTPPSGSGSHAPSGTGTHPTPAGSGTHATPGSPGTHATPGGSGGGLPSPPGHQPPSANVATAPAPGGTGGGLPSPPGHTSPSDGPSHSTPSGSGGGLPSPPGHPSPSAGGGLPSPPGHPAPTSGGGLPSPPGHASPSTGTDHSTPTGSGGTTPHDSGTKPHDTTPNGSTDTKPHDAPDGTKPHDTTPSDSGTKPHDTDTKPHDTDTKPHDADGAKPHDTDGTKPHDTDGAKPHDTDAKPHDADGAKPDDTDAKPHDTDTSGAEDVKPHDPHPGDPTPTDHETDAKPHDSDSTGGRDGAGDGGDGGEPTPRSHDMAPQFGEDAIRAQGEGYQQQLEHMLPTEADRERYEELSKKPTTELSAAEAQHVADIRNQIPVGGDQIVTKVLSQGALDGYLNDDPSKQWQGVQGSIARGVDVVDMNNPKGLRDGLALDDGMGDKGWSPIKENQPEAYQMRWKPGDTVDDLFVPYGGPQKDTYASPAEQAHYDASAKQMASAGGTATETRMQAPFTGSGSTGGGVPEWQAPRGSSLGQRAEIWQLNADGSPERLHAVYESGLGWKKA